MNDKINGKDIIDKDGVKWYKAKTIALLLGYINTGQAISNNIEECNKIRSFALLNIEPQKRSNNMRGYYINKIGIRQLIMKSKMMPSTIKKVCDEVGIKMNILNDKIISKEQNELDKIFKVFKNEKINFQKKVGSYRIDMYFENYDLAIECDEFNHKYRDEEYENSREKYLIKKLKCKFIRFDPDDKDYDVFDIIRQIHEFIKKYAMLIDNMSKLSEENNESVKK